jgi:hypothetical protein
MLYSFFVENLTQRRKGAKIIKNNKLGLFKIFFAALRLCVKTNHR